MKNLLFLLFCCLAGMCYGQSLCQQFGSSNFDVEIFANDNLSNYPAGFFDGKRIKVNGEFTVDVDFEVSDGVFYMEPNSKIIVLPTIGLKLNECVFYNCDSDMLWDGIELSGQNFIEVENSSFENGRDYLSIDNAAWWILKGNTFGSIESPGSSNLVRIKNSNGCCSVIDDCTFDGFVFGLEIQNVENIAINNCAFTDGLVGISLSDAAASIKWNTFKDLSTGVYSIGSQGYGILYFQGFGREGDLTFIDCERGFNVANSFNSISHLNSRLSQLLEVNANISTTPSQIFIRDTRYNEFEPLTSTGMESIIWTENARLEIDNSIFLGAHDEKAFEFIGGNTTIRNSFFSVDGREMEFINATGIVLDSWFNFCPVVFESMNSTVFTDNEIEQNISNSTAVNLVQTNNNLICNNLFNNGSTGLEFDMNCLDTRVSGNTFGNYSSAGIRINSVIGPQEHEGNIFEGPFANIGAAGGMLPDLSKFTVNPTVNPLFLPDTYTPGLFTPDLSTNEVNNCHFIQASQDDDIELTALDSSIVKGTTNFNLLDSWLSELELYNNIENSNLLLNNELSSFFYDWYGAQSETNVQYFSNIKYGLGNLWPIELTASVDASASVLEQLLGETLDDPYDGSGTVDQYIQLSQDYSIAESDFLSAVGVLQEYQVGIIENIRNTHELITPTSSFEEVTYDIIPLYLEFLQGSKFESNSEKFNIIYTTAELCPEEYGFAVFWARAILRSHKIAYSESKCDSKLVEIRSRKDVELVHEFLETKIYPNPVLNRLNIINKGENLDYTIFDVNGNLVYKERGCKVINTEFLSSGIYYLIISNGNESFEHKRFIKL